ncbi:oligoendopeptidase F [Mycoplasmopsis canis]|uniref:oligoendopeptidase F n=1 Tax=Mycoplasmopsis canis TaxID=29555 RepID=UPI00025AF3A2|nr:oligoendopeptidase F [Mycoplasmopsis canis]EIE40175.1 oligoendopeptidase F [Mycoplasmopsis canis UF33]EIE41529.1 oligoendopeptidase F [Mycoplasmopsis canis UFG1]
MEVKQYKNHKEVPSKYKWDLDDILKGKSIHYWIDEYEKIMKQRINIKDSKFNSIEEYLVDIELAEKQELISNKIDNYISNNQNTDIVNADFIKLSKDFELKSHELSKEFGSETNRFFIHIEKMKNWKEDSRLKLYKRDIEDLIASKDHKLDDKIEEFLLETSIGEPDPHSIFSILSNSELDFGYITLKNGKKVKLDKVNRTKFLKSDDSKVRKQAFNNFWDGYIKHKDSFAEILFQHFNKLVTVAKVRKYKSAVEMLTFDDKVTDKTLLKLFNKVSEKRNIIKKYVKNYKIFYKKRFKEDFNEWDSMRDLVKVKSSYSVEEMNELVKESLKPFGEEYSEQINKALTENWVDYMSAKTKRGGAYSIGGTYGIDKKYILMNFDGTLRSVETLAHELGHSMHSYYSDKHNDINNASYPIFLAEIASIFNELMLFDYLLKNSKNDKLKFNILDSIISGFNGTVLKQVMWSNYEYDLYKGIQEGKINSSYDSISKTYFENAKKYSLKDKISYSIKNTIQSIYVPHYYYGFYVYKYAIGQLVAIYFFKQYKNYGKEALDNYIKNFLSAGGNDYPIEILKKVGVDLNDDKFYDEGFQYIEDLVQEWTKLGKKIFK